MMFTLKQVLLFLALGFAVGVAADAYINTQVTKQMCVAQRENKRLQLASPAQHMLVDAQFTAYLPKLPAKELRK